jgi:hypothetical protein
MTISLPESTASALTREATEEGKLPEELAREVLSTYLRQRRIPQTIEELTPRKPLPPGKTLKDVLEAMPPWPGNETDEELLTALKVLDD